MAELLTTPQAAKILGVSPRSLEGYRRRNVGPPFIRLAGDKQGRVRYDAAALAQYLALRTVETSEARR